MSKIFKLVKLRGEESETAHSTSSQTARTETDWSLCFICQEITQESLTCPSRNTRQDKGRSYSILAGYLKRFNDLGILPKSFLFSRLDEGSGVEAALLANNALYHKTCALRYNKTKLDRAKKRRLKIGEYSDVQEAGHLKRTRRMLQKSHKSCHKSAESRLREDRCFFCDETAGNTLLHEAATFQLDSRVRSCAMILGDMDLQTKLNAGDMVAQDAKYHRSCLVNLYNRVRRFKEMSAKRSNEKQAIEGLAFAQLVMFIEEALVEGETAPVFKLADLAQLYASRMEQMLGAKYDRRVHTTRLKKRLLAHFPNMCAQHKGRDVLLAFNEDLGDALAKACELDADTDAVHLARAAQIVRRYIIGDDKVFNGFPPECQENSVPSELLALVTMILEGPSIKDLRKSTTQAALSISQLLKFNSLKHRRVTGSTPRPVRHATAQETPLPIYIGLILHAHTRKKELVDKLAHMGISISYDRVLFLSTQLGNSACHLYHQKEVVCPPKMRSLVFTTAAVDNIDHNPSSTTSKQSFHGTAISLVQHPAFHGAGVDRSISILGGSNESGHKTVNRLPQYYTDVPPTNSIIKNTQVPTTNVTSLSRNSCIKQHIDTEYLWLQHTQLTVQETSPLENTSWAAYHTSLQSKTTSRAKCPTALLPLFLESAHSVAMIKHSMDVIRKSVEHLNPGQIPVITLDQPLFAMAKQIQWKWPQWYGEEKFVILFGGLHIEMAALKTIGDLLQGSGWVQALVEAEITSTGIADSFLRASHVTRTRRAHQVTAAALFNLQQNAYKQYIDQLGETSTEQLEFANWYQQKAETCPQFHYWATILELELTILVYVRSLRQASFEMYLDALQELVVWFYALDHTNYARWIPVHLRDMVELPTKNPQIANEFRAGNFTVNKTARPFSAIPIDQAHEQNNAAIKGDGGAVGLTDNPSALRRWMVAGPEVARLIEEFKESNQDQSQNTKHHDQSSSVQTSFQKDVQSLIKVMEDFGNPFEEDSQDLLVLDTKEIAPPQAVADLRRAYKVGKAQFDNFVRERLVERTKPIQDPIKRNNIKIFGQSATKPQAKGKQQVKYLKNDVNLFSRLYIGCQNRDGNLDEFFRHENQAFPPALSESGGLRFGVKSDLLACLEDVSPPRSEVPPTSCIVLDGAVIIQLLKPATAKTFNEYAQQDFVPHILSKVYHATRLDLVWDSYIKNSLKGTARAKRGKGVRRRVVGGSTIPNNWSSFLRVDENKTELFAFLSDVLYDSFHLPNKELLITKGDDVLRKPALVDTSSLAPCNHEEADTRIMLHAAHAAHNGHKKILICTVDTDVVVLAVALASTLNEEVEVWVSFGSGKMFRFLAAHEIARVLGPEKADALPMFHALTGCDTVSCFAGRGKKTAWAVWTVLPELTKTLTLLSTAPDRVTEDAMHSIERFVILLYDRTSTDTDINKGRRKMFSKKYNVQLIPPTRAALEQHVRRAVYQGGHVWGQALVPAPTLPSPTDWGWIKTSGGYEPLWTTLPEASKICWELVSCKCKDCTKKCKCKKAGLECTPLCICDGECSKLNS